MSAPSIEAQAVRVAYPELREFVGRVFGAHGLPADRAGIAAEALLYGDLSGMTSHGLANLSRLYLPLFESGRVDAAAAPETVSDTGAAVLLDGNRALGLWSTAYAMRLATERAERYGIGLVSMRNGTHFGCAGYHAAVAAEREMVGVVAANCGRQRIARPPGGRAPMLGTNPLAVAAPAGEHPPFVLDMSTTVVPTGRIRQAARAGEAVPDGWLADDAGRPVNDPAAFDRGEAHLQWLGGRPETGSYKGYGLGLMVEVLAALVPGAGLGPVGDADRPADDDIGILALAIAPGTLRSGPAFAADSAALFGALLNCPPVDPVGGVTYPGWHEGNRARQRRRTGLPLTAPLYDELHAIAEKLDTPPPRPLSGDGSAS